MALDCLLNKALLRADACGYSLKQIVNVYLANFNEGSGDNAPTKGSVTVDTDGYTVKSVSGDFFKIEVAKDSASYEDSLAIGGNGSKYRTHSLTFSVNGAYKATIAEAVDDLSLGKFIAILELSDGGFIVLGRLTGLEATVVTSLSEAASDGQNGINVTLECATNEPALPLDDSLKVTVAQGKASFA